MPRRLAQQRMTLSDLEWPFHASRGISAVAELVIFSPLSQLDLFLNDANHSLKQWLLYPNSRAHPPQNCQTLSCLLDLVFPWKYQIFWEIVTSLHGRSHCIARIF